MDFSLNQDQQLLKDSVERYFGELDKNPPAHSNWATFAELGWLAMPFSEDQGGYGAGIVESCLLMSAMGRHGIRNHYWESILLAGRILATACVNNPAHCDLLSSVLAGDCQLGLALFEQNYADQPDALQCSAAVAGQGWEINGEKILVANPDAEQILVFARTQPQGELNAFVVANGTAGITPHKLALMDNTDSARLVFNQVLVPAEAKLFVDGKCQATLDTISEEAIVALCAEAQGAMDALLQQTLEYSRNRKQFGVAIGSFQALQHRMVDMYRSAELCRALLLRAQCAVLDVAEDRAATIAALKAFVGKKSRQLAEEAVQLHGGMGVSEEMPIGGYLRRLMMIDATLGNADIQRRRFCDLRYAEPAHT